jgi:hypothetical protein
MKYGPTRQKKGNVLIEKAKEYFEDYKIRGKK